MTVMLLVLSIITLIIQGGSSTPLCDVDGNDWDYSESLDFSTRKRIITTNSCPNHFSKCQDSECSGPSVTKANHHSIRYELPLFPVMARQQVDATCVNGTIAIALNGVSIESMSATAPTCVQPVVGGQSVGDRTCGIIGEGDGTKECGDAVQRDGTSFDMCGGHVDDRGLYHYHVPPPCLLNQLSVAQTAKDPTLLHSPQMGWALDGFPVYGPVGPLGVVMMACGLDQAHPVFCLDECNGMYAALDGVDEYMYRYYVSGEVGSGECSSVVENAGNCSRVEDKCCLSTIPSEPFRPYTIGCFKGCRYDESNCLASEVAGTSDAFYPALSTPLAGVHSSSSGAAAAAGSGGDVEVFPPTSSPPPSAPVSVDVFENYTGYGFTAVRLENRALGVIKTQLQGTASNEVLEFSTGSADAYITGLTLGHRASSETDSELIFTTQSGVYSMLENGQERTRFVSGVKSVSIEGYNFGTSEKDIRFVTVKGANCSHTRLVSSQSIVCLLTHLTAEDTVDANDVTLSTVSSETTGVHLQPLTIARGRSRRAVMSKISTTSFPFVPYGVAYPVAPSSQTEEVSKGGTYVYWSDIGARRLYRCLVDGSALEVVLTDVHRIYGLAVVSLGDGNHHVYYVDAKRGVVGRLLRSAEDRGEEVHAGSPEDIIVLKDLEEPRGLSVDVDRGFLFLTLQGGIAFRISLSNAAAVENSVDAVSVPPSKYRTGLPHWVSRVFRSRTSSRLDGVGVVPFSSQPSSTPIWKEQFILIPDASSNSINFVSEDGFTLSSVSLYEGMGVANAVVWPRSIAVRRGYSSEGGNDTAVLYIGEILGRVWRVQVNIADDAVAKISLESVGRPRLLLDASNYASSIELRRMINARKSIESRSLLIFPDILD